MTRRQRGSNQLYEPHKFLRDQVKLELSPNKTPITHGRTQAARFVGYETVALHADHKHDQPGHRNINATIGLKVPIDVALSITGFTTVTQFEAEYRGVAEHYWLAFNRHRLGCLKYVVERSLTKTVVHEYEHAA